MPDAERLVAFDKFHVAKYLGDAVDKVRRAENKALRRDGCDDLVGTRYGWLCNSTTMSRKQWAHFKTLCQSTLKTAWAWALKETAMSLWAYISRTWAAKDWKRWLSWAMHCRLEPMKKVAKTIKTHLWGILNAIALEVTNGGAESMNGRIKLIKARSRGFRNEACFRNTIYFHLGDLELYPEGVKR